MKIAVTGIGIISALGMNSGDTYRTIFSENKWGSFLRPSEFLDAWQPMPVGEVRYSTKKLAENLKVRICSRTALLGMFAAKEAFNDARLDSILADRIALVSATTVGGMDLSENFYEDFHTDSKKGRLRMVIGHDCYDSTRRIATFCNIKGFVTTLSTACSSSANAIILGAHLIEQGMADAVIAGGTDSLCRFTLNGFNSLRILDSLLCRPFDAERSGLNLGEGAGYIVLQKSDSIADKKAYCYLSGYANRNDAFHQTASSASGTGAYLAMQDALKMAGIIPPEIDYINTHGTGTYNNDEVEGKAMIRLFGEKLLPAFSSTKPFTGHTLGAAGGIEAVLSVLAIRHGVLYPNLNFKTVDPTLNIVPNCTLRKNVSVRHVLSNSFGFGGSDTSLIFSSN